MSNKRQIHLVKFALKYPDDWFNYSKDWDQVDLMCATSNLGIIKLKDGQFKLKSAIKAQDFLGPRS